ncbi:MAG: response regulator receiver modulated CheW protein [Herbinix sp.]|jgi:chemotaxis signal transduction protein|nr:response regulator receiver modulated CheW protein [Herbinix sp.]
MDNSNVKHVNTKEAEILEFIVGGNSYGITVSEIREILPYQKTTPVPNSNPCIEGLTMPRDFLITVIDMYKSLNIDPNNDIKSDMLIVTSLYNNNIGIHVDRVAGIHNAIIEEVKIVTEEEMSEYLNDASLYPGEFAEIEIITQKNDELVDEEENYDDSDTTSESDIVDDQEASIISDNKDYEDVHANITEVKVEMTTNKYASGIIRKNENIIVILDFNKMFLDINPEIVSL